MNLDDFIITCFVLIDEMMPSVTKGKRLRERGPLPKLADSEVITMELVGTYLGFSQDQEVFDYFRRHYTQFFPEMARVDRTTFVRQAANLWAVKERLWCLIRDSLLLYDPTVAIVDSMPIPVCQFARAYRCHRFDDTASFGKDHTCRQTFYGFRLHLRLCWPGVITQMYLAPANVHEGEVVWDLTAGTSGLLLGDRNYWLPTLQAALRQIRKVQREAVSICPERIARTTNGVKILEIAHDRNDEISALINNHIPDLVVSSENFLDTHGSFPLPTSSLTSSTSHVTNVEDYITGLALHRQ